MRKKGKPDGFPFLYFQLSPTGPDQFFSIDGPAALTSSVTPSS
jgi:hypothetical protein